MELQYPPETLPYQDPSERGRQPLTTSSCAECRRRRVKCEGRTTPCRQCIYYLVPHLCHYPTRKQRRNVSLRSHAELADIHAKAQKVIDTLFPSSTLEELSSMTRQQLSIRLQSSTNSPSVVNAEPHDSLKILEPSLEQNFIWEEVSDNESETSRIADDVNGLAFSRQSPNASYLGLSSVPTILRVIAHLCPHVQQQDPPGPQAWRSPTTLGASPGGILFSKEEEITLINAYFSHVHPIIPMVDEADFRQRYAETDTAEDEATSWLALLNMVLAMGSMASDSTHFSGHNFFYKRALPYLNMSSFGSGHLHMVQALALYSGMVLHFLNKPNMAVAVMGATIRMAVAMGLHKAQVTQFNANDAFHPTSGSTITRIRTWWCLLCLDTWASSTLGRPSLGYWNPTTILTTSMSALDGLAYETISLDASEQFCRIATRIQERLIQLPLVSPDEVSEFDRDLLAWRGSLHMFLAHREQCPPALNIARAVLWWRYITTRLTLYRPSLLIAALHRKPWTILTAQERTHVRRCLEIATEGIKLMSMEWSPNQFLCWNSAWNLFQVTLVLVLGLISYKQEAEQYNCSECIIRAIDLFARMEPIDSGCTRTRKLIQLLFDNAKNFEPSTPPQRDDVMSSSILDSLDLELLGEDIDWIAEFCNES